MLKKFGKNILLWHYWQSSQAATQEINSVVNYSVVYYLGLYWGNDCLLIILHHKLKAAELQSMLSYFVCLFHVTDFDTCCWVESWKCSSCAGCEPFVANKNLWKVKKITCLYWLTLVKDIMTVNFFIPAAAALGVECSYLGVSDILDFDGLWERQSWDLCSHSIRCCSVLCHSGSAVQSRASLSALSTQTVAASLPAFYKNVEFLPPHTAAEESQLRLCLCWRILN